MSNRFNTQNFLTDRTRIRKNKELIDNNIVDIATNETDIDINKTDIATNDARLDEIEANVVIETNVSYDGVISFPNQSRIRAYRNTAQTLNNGVLTIIAYNTETYDNQNEYNNATYTFTAKVSGYYLITAVAVLNSGATANGRFFLRIYKGTTLIADARDGWGGGFNVHVGPCVSTMINMVAGNTILIRGLQINNLANALSLSTGQGYNVCIHKLS